MTYDELTVGYKIAPNLYEYPNSIIVQVLSHFLTAGFSVHVAVPSS